MKTLVEKKLVTLDTVIKARVTAKDFSGINFKTIKDINWNETIKADDIMDIEGMDPERFAKSYSIKPDGSVKVYKKRGRKPKQTA